MSRIYHALEKAESKKGPKTEEDSIIRIFGEEKPTSTEESIPGSPGERIKIVEFPPGDGTPFIISPPQSYSAEQFRKVKTRILNQSPPPRSILITSTIPGEGKSMVAFNLALSFAQENHIRTVLVDADLRNSSFSHGLSSLGLSEYLAGQTPWEDILLRLEAQNLFVIPAGTPSPKAPELIASPRMKALLKNLREWGEETYILIDAPPIQVSSEPLIFSKLVDGIILVVMSDRAPQKMVCKAVETIGREKIIGVVFNQISAKVSKHDSDYYDRYYRK